MGEAKFFKWDSEITADTQEYIVLPEGDYPFQVQGLEKQIYEGESEKIGKGCPMAVLKIVVGTDEQHTSVTDRLYLATSMEWKLGSFFRAIGQKTHGKAYKMDWNNVVGKEGLCHVKVRTYTGNDGQPKQTNQIDRYLECEAVKAPTAPKKSIKKSEAEEGDLPFEV